MKRLRLILIQQVFIDRDETQIANVRKKEEKKQKTRSAVDVSIQALAHVETRQ